MTVYMTLSESFFNDSVGVVVKGMMNGRTVYVYISVIDSEVYGDRMKTRLKDCRLVLDLMLNEWEVVSEGEVNSTPNAAILAYIGKRNKRKRGGVRLTYM